MFKIDLFGLRERTNEKTELLHQKFSGNEAF